MNTFLLEGPGGLPGAKQSPDIQTDKPFYANGGLRIGSAGTSINSFSKYSSTLTPASVAADTSAEQTFTVTGLTTSQVVVVNGPTPTAGTGIVNARVSAANTLALTFINSTAAAATPASGVYSLIALG